MGLGDGQICANDDHRLRALRYIVCGLGIGAARDWRMSLYCSVAAGVADVSRLHHGSCESPSFARVDALQSFGSLILQLLGCWRQYRIGVASLGRSVV